MASFIFFVLVAVIASVLTVCCLYAHHILDAANWMIPMHATKRVCVSGRDIPNDLNDKRLSKSKREREHQSQRNFYFISSLVQLRFVVIEHKRVNTFSASIFQSKISFTFGCVCVCVLHQWTNVSNTLDELDEISSYTPFYVRPTHNNRFMCEKKSIWFFGAGRRNGRAYEILEIDF